MDTADQIQSLLSFVSEVTSQSCERSEDMPQTYKAFASCLWTFIKVDLAEELTEMEKKIISQGRSSTCNVESITFWDGGG